MDMIDLKDYIESLNGRTTFKLLPLCHTTTEGYFSQIFNTGMLEPTLCPEYNERLLYFYYGKASYLVDQEGLAVVDAEPPIALLYEFVAVEKAAEGFKRLLPFDSGGFQRYGFSKGTHRKSFTIAPDRKKQAQEIHDLIDLIYKDNAFYLKDNFAESKLDAESQHCWAVSQLDGLYNVRVKHRSIAAGKQALTLELQVGVEIKVTPIVIIFPYELLTKTFWTKERIQKIFPGVELETYGEPGVTETGMELQEKLRAMVATKAAEHAV
jgi:hypothetical protein